MSILGMPAHDPPSRHAEAARSAHPLAGVGRPTSWTVVVIVLVIVIRWSAEQITTLLGALVPLIAVLCRDGGNQLRQA